MKCLATVSVLLTFVGCRTTEESQSDSAMAHLMGQWAMDHVYDSGQDVTDQHNPAGNRWISFIADGSFVPDGDPHGRNAGQWIFDEQTSELYLDSDAGEGDDSYWIVSFEEEQMRWKGARSDFTARFELVHVRQKDME